MTQYKVGDKVRCRRGYTFDPAEGIIERVGANIVYVKIYKGHDNLYHAGNGEWVYGLNHITLIGKKIVKKYGIAIFLEEINAKV